MVILIIETARKIISILNPQERNQLVILSIITILMAFFQALSIASILPFVSIITHPEVIQTNYWLNLCYTTLNFSSNEVFIFFIGVGIFIFLLLSNIISALATWLKLRFVWGNNHTISKRLLIKYMSQPYTFFLNRSSAELSKNILDEINQLSRGYLIPLINLITAILVITITFLILFIINPFITLLSIVLLGVPYLIVYYLIQPKTKRRGKERVLTNKDRFKYLSEAFGGIKDLKFAGRENFFIKRYSRASKKNAKLLAENAVIGEVPRYAFECVAFGGIILLILVLLSIKEDIDKIIPIISVFVFAGYRIMPSFHQIFQSLTTMSFSHAVLDNIYHEMMALNQYGEYAYMPIDKSDIIPLKNFIQLKNVSFYYSNTTEPSLHNINLVINRNTSVAFVGSTGSGKTTLVDIILGLLQPQEGELVIDNIKITQDNVRNYQKNIGYVPQNIYLSDDTITRNIAFGIEDDEIDIEKVKKAARIANIDVFIEKETPDGYDTVIGERGIRLSGGQRQRIGIARALYHDPEVIILDEATSSLDGITEESFIEALEDAVKVKTLIIVAHRFTTIKKCDIIFLIDKGKIIAQGNYDELMKTNPRFQAMSRTSEKRIK
jgi:ABC-type multidrug transport system fused ATPase/permease subunit